MATTQNPYCISVIINDVSAMPVYHCCKLNSSGEAVICDTAGEGVFGIVQELPANDGEAGLVCVFGACKAAATGAFTAGDKLAVTVTGELDDTETALKVNTSDSGAAADPVIGSHIAAHALADASGAGSIVEVLFTGPCQFKVTAG